MKKRHKTLFLTIIALAIFSFSTGYAQQMFIYPNQGQSSDQQSRDEFECQQWAKNQTGVDPHQLAQQQTHAPQARRGQVFSGAARGAALGVIGGAIAGGSRRVKRGAAIGAGVGAAGGYANQRQQEHQSMQYHEQANRQRRELMNTYNRAYRACLEGRGYTIR